MKNYYAEYKVTVPEGKSGIWSVEKFTVSQRDAKFFNLRQAINSHRGYRPISHGKYTRLAREGAWDAIMTDTPAEIRDHLDPIYEAKGYILINGLGLGVVLNACLKKKEVEHCTVVEKSEDVIKLVAPHYYKKFGHKRLTIVQDDAFTFNQPKLIKPPSGKFDMVWHDLWDNICVDNLPEYTKLKRRYAKRTRWQGCWAESFVKMNR